MAGSSRRGGRARSTALGRAPVRSAPRRGSPWEGTPMAAAVPRVAASGLAPGTELSDGRVARRCRGNGTANSQQPGALRTKESQVALPVVGVCASRQPPSDSCKARRAIIAEHRTVPAGVRAHRRSKEAGKALNKCSQHMGSQALEAPANEPTIPGRRLPGPRDHVNRRTA